MTWRLAALAAALLAVMLSFGWQRASQVRRVPLSAGSVATTIAAVGEVDVTTGAASAAGDVGATLAVLPGPRLLIAVEPSGAQDSVWLVHVVGLLSETFGVFLSFYLARAAGMVPQRLRSQILTLSLVLGIASYATTNAAAVVTPVLTPAFVFSAIKDGFVWAAAFPMFASAFGMSDEVEPPATSAAP